MNFLSSIFYQFLINWFVACKRKIIFSYQRMPFKWITNSVIWCQASVTPDWIWKLYQIHFKQMKYFIEKSNTFYANLAKLLIQFEKIFQLMSKVCDSEDLISKYLIVYCHKYVYWEYSRPYVNRIRSYHIILLTFLFKIQYSEFLKEYYSSIPL